MTFTLRALRLLALVVLTGTSLAPRSRAADAPPAASPVVTESPPYGEFVVVPLRVHVLTSKDLPEVDCHLTDADITRILGKVNGVWHKAGVHWGLESVVREPAEREEKFRLARDLGGDGNLSLFRLLAPDESREFDGLHVYYIHKFAVNGVWLGGRSAFVQETAKLRPVDGGIDEPIPRVTAHELGHALGLPHRQDRTNLLASGTTGTLLNAQEVKVVREKAVKVPGAKTVADLKTAAEKAEGETVRRLWTWLAEVPGDGAEEAKKRLEMLD